MGLSSGHELRLLGRVSATTAATVRTGKTYLRKIVHYPAAAASTVTVYNQTSAVAADMVVVTQANASAAATVIDFDPPLYLDTGLHAVPTGAGSETFFYEGGLGGGS